MKLFYTTEKDGLFSQISKRLLIAILLFTILDVTFVLFTYIGNVPELGQRLLSRQAEEIAKGVQYKSSKFTYDKSKFRREYIGDAKLAYAIYDKEGLEIFIAGNQNLAASLMPPITSVTEETRRDDYKDSFQLRGVRQVKIDNRPIWISLAVEGRGFRPLLPIITLEVIDHVALPLIPLSILLLIFNVIAVRKTLLPLTKAIEQINIINPQEIEQRLDVPNSPLEVKYLATAMNQALSRIESAIHSLRDFTADAAHELRTPLAIMTMEVENLPESNGKKKLKHDVTGMTRLVSQMLDMAYADGLIINKDNEANVSEIASDVIRHLSPLALSMSRHILFNDRKSHNINGHPEAIGRALRNIIENALVHTPINTNVEVTIGSDAQIVVRDYGPGIPKNKEHESLNRFWQGDRQKTQGAGLGLAIATRIVRAHGGKIEISSANDGGAIIKLNLKCI